VSGVNNRNNNCSIICSLWGGAVTHYSEHYLSVFHKYSVGGDTTAQIGLYARFCHAFLLSSWLCPTDLVIICNQ